MGAGAAVLRGKITPSRFFTSFKAPVFEFSFPLRHQTTVSTCCQVESPSPELGWLVCHAITGSSRHTTGGDSGSRTGTAAAAAAAAGLLDDEAFFRHFFGRLTGEGEGDTDMQSPRPVVDGVRGGVGGDGADARILEQVILVYSSFYFICSPLPLWVKFLRGTAWFPDRFRVCRSPLPLEFDVELDAWCFGRRVPSHRVRFGSIRVSFPTISRSRLNKAGRLIERELLFSSRSCARAAAD